MVWFAGVALALVLALSASATVAGLSGLLRRRWQSAFTLGLGLVVVLIYLLLLGGVALLLGPSQISGPAVDPTEKARTLGEKISDLMNISWWGGPVGLALGLALVIRAHRFRAQSVASRSLPSEVVVVALRWLDELDAAVTAIIAVSASFEAAFATNIAVAAADVSERSACFRDALAGRRALTDLLAPRWVPLRHIDIATANLLAQDIRRAVALPPEVIAVAHSLITDDAQKRAYLRQVGEVAGAAFVSLARSIWEDYPHLATPGWGTPNSGNDRAG